jgi:hypothetical protein
MRFLKQKLGRWTGPAILCALVITALGVTTVVGAPKFITGKKVNKTIKKKTNATELRIAGTKSGDSTGLDAANAVVASLDLSAGNYVVTSTFSTTRNGAGQVGACALRLTGVAEDKANFFSNAESQDQESGATSVAGVLGAAGTAQLRCTDFGAGAAFNINDIEITALKVPKLTLIKG